MLWSDFDAHVMPYVLGCPLPLLEHHARKVCIDWCNRTHCWQEALEPEFGTGHPVLEIPTAIGFDVVKVLCVDVDGREIEAVHPDIGRGYVRSHHPGDFCFTPDEVNLHIYQPPKNGAQIVIEAALSPSITSTGMPVNLFRQYATHIAPGIVASIQEVPNQPFSNLQHADRMQARYEARLRSVASSISVGRLRAKTRSSSTMF